MWLDAAYYMRIQPSEFDRLSVGRMRDLAAEIEKVRAEIKKQQG